MTHPRIRTDDSVCVCVKERKIKMTNTTDASPLFFTHAICMIHIKKGQSFDCGATKCH